MGNQLSRSPRRPLEREPADHGGEPGVLDGLDLHAVEPVQVGDVRAGRDHAVEVEADVGQGRGLSHGTPASWERRPPARPLVAVIVVVAIVVVARRAGDGLLGTA